MRLKGQRVNPKTRTASSRAVAWGERTHNARRYATRPVLSKRVRERVEAFRRDPARLGVPVVAASALSGHCDVCIISNACGEPVEPFDAFISRKTWNGPHKAEGLQGETDGTPPRRQRTLGLDGPERFDERSAAAESEHHHRPARRSVLAKAGARQRVGAP